MRPDPRNNHFNGRELYRLWEASRFHGGSQRRLAQLLDMSYNALHGKIWRFQQRLKLPEVAVPKRTYPKVMLRATVLDIETMSLHSGGRQEHMVCTSSLPLDAEKPDTFPLRFEDDRDDRRLLTELSHYLEHFDILIGHNLAPFDLNWLNSRLMYHALPPMRRFLYYDTYLAARRMCIKADRKSLAFLVDYFRLEGVKTSVLPVSWSMIDSPRREDFDQAMADIVYHCEQDVLANRNLFDVLWPRDRGLANLPMTKKW